MNQGGEVERDGHHVAVRGRVSLASFRVKRRVLDATYRSFNVDDLSTFFQKFARDSMEKPANFAGSSDPYVWSSICWVGSRLHSTSKIVVKKALNTVISFINSRLSIGNLADCSALYE